MMKSMNRKLLLSVGMVAMFISVSSVYAQTTPTPAPFPVNATLDANCVGTISVPDTVYAGETFKATVTLINESSVQWRSNQNFKLGSQAPQDNLTWGFSRVALPREIVSRNAAVSFRFEATAPQTPGQYPFSWQMLREGHKWFGDICTEHVPLTVKMRPNNAIPISRTGIPSRVTSGQQFTAKVTMKNISKREWKKGEYQLGATGYTAQDRDNTTWGVRRVDFDGAGPIQPGDEAVFTINATAPTVTSTKPFAFAWKMVAGDEWFGVYSIRTIVVHKVVSPTPTPTLTPTPTASPEVPSTFTFSSRGAIRSFVNSVSGADVIDASGNNAGAAAWDEATRLKICNLKGYSAVDSNTSTSGSFSSPSDNTIVLWDAATSKFVTKPARGNNLFIAKLTCSNPIVQATPSSTPIVTPTVTPTSTPTPEVTPFIGTFSSPVGNTAVPKGQGVTVNVAGQGNPVCATWKLFRQNGNERIFVRMLTAADFVAGELPGGLPVCTN